MDVKKKFCCACSPKRIPRTNVENYDVNFKIYFKGKYRLGPTLETTYIEISWPLGSRSLTMERHASETLRKYTPPIQVSRQTRIFRDMKLVS